jgi:hypothetical protein
MSQLLLGTCTWTVLGLFILSICKTARDGIAHLKKLHQIPCSRCAFFTGNYHLKCTVNPLTALSEESINCRDFELKTFPACSRSQASLSAKKLSQLWDVRGSKFKV